MNLIITRNVENNKFQTVVAFESFGATDISEEDEKNLLQNYPCVLNYKDIIFSGKYKVEKGEVVKASVDGEDVSLVIIEKLFPLTEAFQAKYEVSISQVLESELKTELNTKEMVCQAKVKLFEDKIKEQIKKLITEVKAKNNNFEKESPIKVTI